MKAFVKFIATGLLLAAAAYPAAAQRPPAKVLEGSVETYTDRVLFPSSLAGKIQVSECGGCASPLFQLDANTLFNLAGHYVSLREMTAYARGTRGARGKALTINYRLSDSIVSLVLVSEK